MKKIAVFVILLPLLASCESETLTASSGAGVNISGRWSGQLTSSFSGPTASLRAASRQISMILELRQQDLISPDGPDSSRVIISGVMRFQPRYGDCVGGGNIDPEATTLIGNRIVMSAASESGITFTFSGVATESAISGSFIAEGSCTIKVEEEQAVEVAEGEEDTGETETVEVDEELTVTDSGSFRVFR